MYFVRQEVVTFVLILGSFVVRSDRMTSKIYKDLNADNFCFRQLNATHQIGCTSNAAGNVGVVHVVDNEIDLRWILHDGPDPPYIAALSVKFFNMAVMTDLRSSERVTGVLVLQGSENSTRSESFSPDKGCPNKNYGMDALYEEYSSCDWNPVNPGREMMFEDWKMPIVLVTKDSDVDSIVQKCFNQFNAPLNGTARPWPLCAAELGSFMLAAKDSPTCIRRSNMLTNMNPVKLCDPLGSQNIFTTLFPTSEEEPIANRSLIVVAARLDAASMFDGIAPGADSAITSLVTLMSVAKTLFDEKSDIQKNMPDKLKNKNVLFAIFNGESFDYIGSSRAVYDMELNVFPQKLHDDIQQPALINLHHISHFIELHQVGHQKESHDAYWIHTDPVSTKNPEVNKTVEAMINYLKSSQMTFTYQVTDFSRSLPPASVQRFLRKDLNISSIVLTNFNTSYTNKFYNSRYDIEDQFHETDKTEKYLTELSTAVSKTVYHLLTNKDSNLTVNSTLIQDMMDCYLNNASCQLFKQIANPSKLNLNTRTQPYSLYVSVESHGNISPITIFTRYLLSFLTGQQLVNYTESECTSNDTDMVFQYDWMVGDNISNPGVCVLSTVLYTTAISPAVVLQDWESTEYSTWTESVWQTASLRIFLRPSRKLEGLTLGLGCIIFALSLLLVYSANKRADLLFGSRGLIGC